MTNEKHIQATLQFPCDFPIKAMGYAADVLQASVTTIVRKHVPEFDEGAITSRPSANGKYIAVTVSIRATSKEQLDAIYLELTACEHVLMAL